ncbi:rhodanese-like domain-containing protein [Neolewinella lacunae]|uniref:Rhodanese-like domain-containing protein n=1 Tax=Neolewinella lacunae TaxID=1517758 RepID=A0A923PPV4_9BACT|nr:rhodanese-like domain-containing protein [Neolewinella lacunae]MBC6995223.1 rhodanese-like domain-containing protein [Neolewinella lacunae]MDN3635468.1 rhodanese-like domain-containing protein [Neolewinella lacunae]
MKTIYFSVLMLGLLLLSGQILGQASSVAAVAPNAVLPMVAQGTLVIDVREANEIEVLAYDVPGVINIPLSELPDRLAELPTDRPLILACRTGLRSAKAGNLLAAAHFAPLFHIEGGIIAWEAAGLPVKKSGRAPDAPATGQKPCCPPGTADQTTGKSCCAKASGATATAGCGGKEKGKSCGTKE